MGILNSISNAVDKHIVKPGNKLLRTALAVAAISAPIGQAQAKVHQEVNAVVITGGTHASNPNTPSGAMRTYGVNFEYDDADPKNTAMFGKNLLAEKALGQQGIMTMKSGQAMIMGNSLIQQEPAKKTDTFGKGGNVEGLNIYNFNNTLPSSPTTPLYQSSAVLKAEDGFDKMFEENGVRADLAKGLFTTYEMQSGPNGTIVGANVLTTTDLSGDPDVVAPGNSIMGSFGDYIVAMNVYNNNTLMLFKKDAQGNISVVSKKSFPGVDAYNATLRPGPNNGVIISFASSDDKTVIINIDDTKTDLAVTATYPGHVVDMTAIGPNNSLSLYTSVDEETTHIIDGKGGDVKLTGDLNSPARSDFFHSENDTNTYFRLTMKGVYGFQIKSMNPLTIEEFDIAGPDLTAEFLQNHYTTIVDSKGDVKDKDGIHLGDNCVDIANPSQSDLNKNGLGDACDPNPSSVEFGLVDILPVTQYRLLRNPNKPGKTLVNPQGDGDNVSFELDKGSTDKIWFLPQENSKNGVSFTLPAGYSGDISVIDGGVLDGSGNPVTGAITASTSAQTFTLSSAAANVQLVINNDGLPTQGDTTAPDAGSSDTDAGGTTDQDAGSTGSDGGTGSDTGADTGSNPDNGNNGSDTGATKPDTAGKDTASADTGATISSGDKPGADGCTTAPTSSSNAARTTGAVMGLAALAIALRRKEEEGKKKEA